MTVSNEELQRQLQRLDNGLYDRQHDLWLNTNGKAIIIGVGGIGSWVALDMALAGINELVLIDPDELEIHNLNRTPYKKHHAEAHEFKVDAALDLIYERRDSIEVHAFTELAEDVPTSFFEDADYVLDCRDVATPLPDAVPNDAYVVAAGYDGLSITLHLNPEYEELWGAGGEGYEVTPSFVVPPQFLASLVTLVMCAPTVLTDEERVVTIDIRSVLWLLIELGHLMDSPSGEGETQMSIPSEVADALNVLAEQQDSEEEEDEESEEEEEEVVEGDGEA